MAENGVRIGLKNLHYKLLTFGLEGVPEYGEAVKIPGLIDATLSPQVSEGELYADDTLSEFHASITSFDITLGTKDIPLKDRAALLGYPIGTDGRLRVTSNAKAPLVAITFEAERTDGKYQYLQVHKVRFSPIEESFETKGSSISYQTASIKGKSLALEGHDAYYDTIIKDEADGAVGTAWHSSKSISEIVTGP